MKTNKNKKDIVLTPEEVAQFRALGWEGIMNKAKSYNPNAEKTSKKKGCKKKVIYSYHPSLASHITISTTASIRLRA